LGKIIMRSYSLLLLVSLASSGCVTSSVAPKTAESANQHLLDLERKPREERGVTDDLRRRLDQLFSDRPDYLAALARDDADARLPRVRSIVPPDYPVLPALAGIRAMVKVAFAVDEEGRVHDPRIFESPDARFDRAALEAVKKWTFFRGEISGKPAVFIMVVPIQFVGMKK
jgi:TonB family protein